MRTLASLSLASLLIAGSLDAQVRGAVLVGGSPIAETVIFGDGPRRPTYRPSYRDSRVVVVEEWRGPRGNARGWWKRGGFREVVIYRDRDRDRYYDRFDRGRRDLVEVVAYERGGRYYDGRRFDDRYDNRFDDRFDNRYDNRRWDDRRWDDQRWDDRRGDDRRDDARYDRRDDRRDDFRGDRKADRKDKRKDNRKADRKADRRDRWNGR